MAHIQWFCCARQCSGSQPAVLRGPVFDGDVFPHQQGEKVGISLNTGFLCHWCMAIRLAVSHPPFSLPEVGHTT